MRPLGASSSADPCAGRLPQLDAVRGIAAFMVVLRPGLLSLPSGASLAAAIEWVPGFAILGLGRPAVVLFFVLSGFVLAPSVAPRALGFVRFATKRAVRLLPPYWAAIAAAFLLLSLAPARPAGGLS